MINHEWDVEGTILLKGILFDSNPLGDHTGRCRRLAIRTSWMRYGPDNAADESRYLLLAIHPVWHQVTQVIIHPLRFTNDTLALKSQAEWITIVD